KGEMDARWIGRILLAYTLPIPVHIFRFSSVSSVFSASPCWVFALSQLATAGRIFEGFPGDAQNLVVAFFDAAQIDVLDRVMSFRHFPLTARAGDVALHFFQRLRQQQTGVVTLHGKYVWLALVLLRICGTKSFVAGIVQRIGVMKRGEQAVGGVSLCGEHAFGKK